MRIPDMKASELFSQIRGDLIEVSGYIAQIEEARRTRARDPPGTLTYLGDYNYATCTEILSRDVITPDFRIDRGSVEKFELALDRYLDTYAPGNKELKRYASSVSLYLTFIAKKPLHPPEVPFSEEICIVKNGEFYYCSGKARFLQDPSSLCRYCVCRPL
jgi:uncharacterized protein (UPF0305 family)